MMAAAWHTAAFYRSKRMPGLHKVIGDTEPRPSSGANILQALKMKFGVTSNGKSG